MSVERIIGVDFGTSTSVIRVKRYEDGNPMDERLSTKPVVFNIGSTVTPTLIRKTKNDTFYGYHAEISKRDSDLFQSFKVLLESSDPAQKAEAKELTASFLKYLAKTYREQSDGGHLGESTDAEHTIVSYPVKWSAETKEFMIESAKTAGFPNVTGMDEASAAIIAATLQNKDALKRKGYLQDGKPINVLLIDMGAGTTDLVLCKYTPGVENDILCTYPKKGNTLFGGKDVDELLGRYIAERVPDEYRATILKKIGIEKYKAWKESVVSHMLRNAETVEEFGALDDLAEMLDFEVDLKLDRTAFEKLLSDYLKGFPELVNGCLKEAKMTGDEVDLVILTGGHSQWYFIKDILTGKNTKYGKCLLGKIKNDSERIISIALPQETVALGLAFSELSEAKVKAPEEGPFLMSVADVIYDKDENGTVIYGKLERGMVRKGDTVEIVGLSDRIVSTTVLKIKVSSTVIDDVHDDENAKILLKGIGPSDIQCGQVICAPGTIKPYTRFVAHFDALDDNASSFLNKKISENSLIEFFFREIVIFGKIISKSRSGENYYLIELLDNVALEEDFIFAVLNDDDKFITIGTVTAFPDPPYDNKAGAKNNSSQRHTDAPGAKEHKAPKETADKPTVKDSFLMPVEDVLTFGKQGIIVTGKIERGTVHYFDTVDVTGLSDETSRTVIDGIIMMSGDRPESAGKGDEIGLVLRDRNRLSLKRGQVICAPGTMKSEKSFSVQIETTDEFIDCFSRGEEMRFWFRTVYVKVKDIDTAHGENAYTVELAAPIAIEEGTSFAVCNGDKVIATGVVGTGQKNVRKDTDKAAKNTPASNAAPGTASIEDQIEEYLDILDNIPLTFKRHSLPMDKINRFLPFFTKVKVEKSDILCFYDGRPSANWMLTKKYFLYEKVIVTHIIHDEYAYNVLPIEDLDFKITTKQGLLGTTNTLYFIDKKTSETIGKCLLKSSMTHPLQDIADDLAALLLLLSENK